MSSNPTPSSSRGLLMPLGDLVTQTYHEQKQPILIALGLGLLVLFVVTRVSTSKTSFTIKTADGNLQPPALPYWVPFLGNLLDTFVYGFDGLLERANDKFKHEGIFSLKLAGTTHYVISHPSLSSLAMGSPSHIADGYMFVRKGTRDGFGFTGNEEVFKKVFYEKDHPSFKHISHNPGLDETTQAGVQQLKFHVTDLVTFNEHETDQKVWERPADVDVTADDAKGDKVVEADLMELVQHFVGVTTSATVFGTDFAENLPQVFQHLFDFDKHFKLLILGLPSWTPVPAVQRARATRRRIFSDMDQFCEALDKWTAGEDPGPQWQNMENVSTLLKWRAQRQREFGMPLKDRAAVDLALLWSSIINTKTAISWMLVECYKDPVLLQELREEIAPFVEVVQPKNDFAANVWLRPEVAKMDADGLQTKCPLLKSCYIETLRVYLTPRSYRYLHDDLVLKNKGEGTGGGGNKGRSGYVLKKGSYVHISNYMHGRDERYWESPSEFRAHRHLVEGEDEDGKKVMRAEMGTLKPYGGGASVCKGKTLAAREIVLWTAMIIATWDIDMVKGKRWEDIKTSPTLGGQEAAGPVRVTIKRRDLPVEE